MSIFILVIALPAFFTCLDLFFYLFTDKRILKPIGKYIIEVISFIGLPLLYLSVLDPFANDCCYESATFSPDHKLSIYCLIVLCIVAYYISSYKKKIIGPVIELLLNVFLVIGICFNIFIWFHVNDYLGWLGNLPIVMLFILELLRSHHSYLKELTTTELHYMKTHEKVIWKILNAELFIKIPLLFLLCFPILLCLSLFMMLFGQKPDSLIRAFTDTYKHGFSQLDHLCDNVSCGGHFLCSVAANGHKNIVYPKRYGIRGGNKIICNRQLLVANAFEDLVQEKFPNLHLKIRKQYNKVGDQIHRYYGVFNIKLVSDIIYFLMKPLEWAFLLTLYTFDKNPENRISKQYLSTADRQLIDSKYIFK